MLRMLLVCLSVCVPALASDGNLGRDLSDHGGLLWVVPFAGMLLSIALMPLLLPKFWHRHFGKVCAFWALAFVVPFAAGHGLGTAAHHVAEVGLHEYLPFILLLGALYVISGGVVVEGPFTGSPLSNASMLLGGTIIASIVGTTGASMLLIRPLLKANRWRKSPATVVVFFIFLVSNIGGSLTPLGDPPLFLGYLRGVPFFWTVSHLLLPTVFATVILLIVYMFIDGVSWKKEDREAKQHAASHAERVHFRVLGKRNLLLLVGVVLTVWGTGVLGFDPAWKGHGADLPGGIRLGLSDILRDVLLATLAGLSLWLTPKEIRARNDFSWAAIDEVAKLFAGIFVAMIPAMAILSAGNEGALSGIVNWVTNPARYFWATGALSSFLDNAPTYVVFFESARAVTHPSGAVLVSAAVPIPEHVLEAISAGAVFMGANTYIGNGPNFMVKSMAQEFGVRMPSFFGYMAWSGCILIPIFVLMTFLFVG